LAQAAAHLPPDAPKTGPSRRSLQETAYAAVITAVVVSAIYFGRPMLVPLALSVLLAFALAPVAEFLRKMRLGRIGATILTVTLAVVFITAIAAFIGTQIAWLAVKLPQYQHNIVMKVASVEGTASNNSLVRSALGMFNNLSTEIAHTNPNGKGTGTTQSTPAAAPAAPATPVIIQQPPSSPIEVITNVGGPLLEPLANLTIIIIFVIFILLQKEDLRDRFILLAGARDLQRTTLAIDDGAQRLSRYLLLQTAVNTVFGLIIGIGLYFIGVPNPALWGLIAAMFRFVPYVGVPIAAVLPLALTVAVDPGWSMMFWTLALYIGLESVTGQAVEPWLYGRNMGLSALAVVVAAGFWTFLWGPVGLLLSTPLTMIMVVIGRHVDQLRFLDVMLGDAPPLQPEESFYLRMMEGNPDEASEQADTYLQNHSLPIYFDQVAVKGLALAQIDANRGVLNDEGRRRIATTVEGFIDNLTTQEDAVKRDETVSHEKIPAGWDTKPVLCVAGRGVLDRAAASLLSHLLERQGIGSRTVSSEEVSAANLEQLKCDGVRVVCVSYLEPGSPKNARYLARRLRKKMPSLPLIAGFWTAIEDDTQYLDSFEATECDFLANNLQEAVDQVIALMKASANNKPFRSQIKRHDDEVVTD
jgi:predicted PurR-regulated permease PerM